MKAAYFDLEQCQKAYDLMGVKKCWIDYSTPDGDWDEDGFYNDFDAWFDSLPEEQQTDIWNKINR